MPPTVAQTAPAFADPAAEASAGFGLSANAACRAEYEDRRVLLPPLPPVAQDFLDELHGYKNLDARAAFQQLDDEWTRSVFLAAAPLVFEDWNWSKDYSGLFVKPVDTEPIDFARPVVTPLAYDESGWPRRFECLYTPQSAEQDLPNLPPNAPAAFDDGASAFAFSNPGSLAALVLLDEFVNAPAGGGTSGSAPLGRSVRFGFSIFSFR